MEASDMARRRKSGAPEISLFPFLSILACVIGTLTLMITALALGQMDNPMVEEVAKHESLEKLVAENQATAEQLRKDIDQAIAESEEKNGDLTALRSQFDRLEQEAERLRNLPPPKADMPKVDTLAHKQRIAALQQEIATLESRIEGLTKQLEDLKIPPEAVVRIQPGGTGVGLNPTFVECAATRLVVFEGDKPHMVRRADIRTDAKFLELLTRIADSEKDTLVFLVRDDAVSTYIAARTVATEKYARNGKLPVIGQGKIDLSLFKKG
jgi:cell division protein FtsB